MTLAYIVGAITILGAIVVFPWLDERSMAKARKAKLQAMRDKR